MSRMKSEKLTEVDIVTPVYGSPEMLAVLYESMMTIDAGVSWHWIVIDDKGPQSDLLSALYTKLRGDSRCKVILSPVNRGFAGINNDAVKRGKARLLLLLNSDTKILTPGWLKTMASEFSDKTVGCVGAKLLYFSDKDTIERPAGKIQHAGVAFNLIGQAFHIFMGWESDNPKVTERREMNAVTGACLMTRRSLYEKLGGLDEQYTKGNFEDVQYCLQVRRTGHKIIYNPNVVLNHYAGGSDNTETAAYNEQLFRLKCRGITEYDDWKYY